MGKVDQEHVLILCPYCGHAQTAPRKCEECGGLFEPLSRKATQIAMGPWYIRDKNRPFRPGCSYEVLQKQIQAGRLKPTTVLRGPTTRQFWSVARNIPGVAHLLGYCHQCGDRVQPSDRQCASCGEKFVTPRERNELGIHYKTLADAAKAQRALDAEIARVTGEAGAEPDNGSGAGPATDASPGGDLLDEVLGASAPVEPIKPKTPEPAKPEPDDEDDFLPAPLPPSQLPANQGGAEPQPAAADNPFSAIDFTPSAAAANGVEAEGNGNELIEDLEGSTRRLGVMTYLFIGFNVIMLAAVVLLLSGVFEPEENGGGGGTGDTPAGDVQPDDQGGDTAQGGGSTPPKSTGGNEPNVPVLQNNPYEPMVQRADQLRLAGKMTEALEILKYIRDKAPPELKPAKVDDLIRQLEDELAKDQAANFFGLPSD